MHCPLTGKPCLIPKEVFVTEVKEDGVRHLFMCHQCGDEYIATLNDAEVVTKSLEVVSSNGDISHNEHILDDTHITETHITEEVESLQELLPPKPITAPVSTIQQIKAVEAKMQAAVDREDYESAAALRDILKELQQRTQRQSEDED
jgi:protein-arginine kinase activator protein McsA